MMGGFFELLSSFACKLKKSSKLGACPYRYIWQLNSALVLAYSNGFYQVKNLILEALQKQVQNLPSDSIEFRMDLPKLCLKPISHFQLILYFLRIELLSSNFSDFSLIVAKFPRRKDCRLKTYALLANLPQKGDFLFQFMRSLLTQTTRCLWSTIYKSIFIKNGAGT